MGLKVSGESIGSVTVPEVAVTTERRLSTKLIAVAVVFLLAVAAFAAGNAVAQRLESDGIFESDSQSETDSQFESDGTSELAMSDLDSGAEEAATSGSGGPEPDRQVTSRQRVATVEPDGFKDQPAMLVVDRPPETLRFVAFAEPVTLIDAETASDLNNSVGFDTTTAGAEDVKAVVTDFVATGSAGSAVSIHPGDRPADAIRFTIPSSGRLLVPHLIVATDDSGRVVVSADQQVQVKMTGIGNYVKADRARAGRFVPTGSVRIGSLVTSTDGRRLVMDLADSLGADADLVGLAVLRLNANVSAKGGSVSVGSGVPIPWAAPPNRDLGLAGTELLTVAPGPDGEITMDYLGGSVLTVDLVGYYTNDRAPASTSGLFVLAPRPELQVLEVEEDEVAVDIDLSSIRPGDTVALAGTVVTVEVANGSTPGTIDFRSDHDPAPASPAFALAANQRRNTTEWSGHPQSSTIVIRAPRGASLNIWTMGVHT